MPLHHKRSMKYTHRFLPLPKPGYVESAQVMTTGDLNRSLCFACDLLVAAKAGDRFMDELNNFEMFCRVMWEHYTPAVWRYGKVIAHELQSRGELDENVLDDLQSLRPSAPYKRPCFLHSKRVHLSSQGFLKYMNNCWALQTTVENIKGDIGYAPEMDFNYVIKMHWNRSWTTLPQHSPAEVDATLAMLISQYHTHVSAEYMGWESRCQFHFAIAREPWEGFTTQQSNSYIWEFHQRAESFTAEELAPFADRIRDNTDRRIHNAVYNGSYSDSFRTIQHLDGNTTQLSGVVIERLYGADPPRSFRGSWPERFADQMLTHELTAPQHRTISRAYHYDASFGSYVMRAEVLAMIQDARNNQQAETGNQQYSHTERESRDGTQRPNTQHSWAHMMSVAASDLANNNGNSFGETDARETDSGTDQVDEGVDAGTEPDPGSPPLHAADRLGTEGEGTLRGAETLAGDRSE